jgi:hypothetical protein
MVRVDDSDEQSSLLRYYDIDLLGPYSQYFIYFVT